MNPDDVITLVQSLQDNAQRLGLTWEIRLATVVDDNPIALTFDGDTDPVQNAEITNISGGPIAVGTRVWAFLVPPAGVYITGVVPSTTSAIGLTAAQTANQPINTGVSTAISWNTKSYDSSGFLTTGGSSITIPSGLGGVYAVTALAQMSASGANNFVEVTINGTIFVRDRSTTGQSILSVSGTKRLVTGDSIVVNAFQTSGIASTMNADLSLFRVG